MPTARFALIQLLSTMALLTLAAQPYGQPDRDQPGDAMIQAHLARSAQALETNFLGTVSSARDWEGVRPQFHAEYMDMLGLSPFPEKTPLRATITRTLDRGDYKVEMLHYQSRPGLYVTGNLYRPAQVTAGERLPAILYVCGHAGRGRNGGKAAFQSHGIWFARHGYICLIVDTLQLGEIPGVHHGTYREGRWWWLSRGYTPAGVECWNGIRGIDYLISRPDVDGERIGVTGISGGGAATFWIAAADERVKVAAPVSGMADLVSYISNRLVNGHCDCMFLYNTYQWPWTRIAALVAPRPMLFVNSDQDPIFPMDANERVINRLERLYSLFGLSDRVDSVVSIGGHAYRKDLRQAVYRFMNTYLKSDPQPVLDSEVDLVSGPREEVHPIAPEELRVFPQDSDIPADVQNGRIDQTFVPLADLHPPVEGRFEEWKRAAVQRLRAASFHGFPDRIPGARLESDGASQVVSVATEDGIRIPLRALRRVDAPERVLLLVTTAGPGDSLPGWAAPLITERDALFAIEPRGAGATRWTTKNPPNYVERCHFLLGRTVASGQVWDIAAVARHLSERFGTERPVIIVGEKEAAVLGMYAAVLEQAIGGLLLNNVPATHMSADAPALLNALRVCDIPDALGMIAPRPVTLLASNAAWTKKTASIYTSAGASDKLTVNAP